MEQAVEVQKEYSERGMGVVLPKKKKESGPGRASQRAEAVSEIVNALSAFEAADYQRVLEAALLCLDDPDNSIKDTVDQLRQITRKKDLLVLKSTAGPLPRPSGDNKKRWRLFGRR